MNAPASARPTLVPSREALFRAASLSLDAGSPVVITGAEGNGRTTFGVLLLQSRAEAGRTTHRISGASALSRVPFAALATLVAHVPGLRRRAATETGTTRTTESAPETTSETVTATEIATTTMTEAASTMTALAAESLTTPRTIFVDHAEHVDAESAAALALLHPAVELIITATRLADLPAEFARLAYRDGTHHTALPALSIDDARVLVEDFLQAPFNASTLNRLYNLSGGNAISLRELVIDAQQHGHLPLLNGYHTLTSGWQPSGTRVLDLMTTRLAEQPKPLRDTLELLALTGPLPRSLATLLCDAAPLSAAMGEGLITVSTANRTKDIAQSFDGSGARQVNEHTEAMVQLGAGFSPELVLAATSPLTIDRHAALITERISPEALPATTRLHLEATLALTQGTSRAAATEASARLHRIAERITELTRQGHPNDGVQLFADVVATDDWHAASPDTQTLSIQAMFLAMMGEGSRPDVFDEHFTSINWHDVSLDHAVFMTGRADLFLELGNATEARELCSQSLGLLSMQDRTNLTGFTLGLDAVASVMLGDITRAKQQYREYRAAPDTSGGLARPEVERLMLLVIRHLEGIEAASARLAELRAHASETGDAFIEMRLLHDAWRLRVVPGDTLLAHLDEMGTIARTVQGSFAKTLSHYADAFRELVTGNLPDGAARVEDVVLEHLTAGRALFAAEVAARAAEIATGQGDRKRSHALLTLFAQATPMLEGVNTPSLGRARIDPQLLSEREAEVCMAAMMGKTNPEIAADLFLSPRTVEGHLQRAYAKLGIADRRQLMPLGNSSADPS